MIFRLLLQLVCVTNTVNQNRLTERDNFKALPLPVDDKSLSEVLHQVVWGNWLRVFMTTIAGEIFFPRRKTTYRRGTINFTTSEMDILDETTSHLEEQEAIRLLRLGVKNYPQAASLWLHINPVSGPGR